MKEYDIILVFFVMRKHEYYANIIKELSPQYKIGLLMSDEEGWDASCKGTRRQQNTGKRFRSFCVDLGAEGIFVNEKVKGKLVIMPVETFFSESYDRKFRENVSWDKLVGLFTFQSKPDMINRLKDLGATKYIAPAKYILDIKYKYEGKLKKIEDLYIVEMGLPHKKYPLFDDLNLEIDYLVAYPSHTHFPVGKEREKYTFVSNLYKLLGKIESSNRIYLKHHSNNDNTPESFRPLSYGSPLFLRVADIIADICLKLSPFKRQRLYGIGARLKCSIIAKKYPSLEKLTPYHNFGIESFLPHVTKGLVTGNSGTHFHALFDELPVYNCDSQENGMIATLPHNTAYLVPPCNGELVFDQSNFSRISKECKDTDSVQLIKEELNGL
jgi:hypothetical protein